MLSTTSRSPTIEAPAIGIGGVGTTAYTAQARVYARLDTSQGLLGSVTGALAAATGFQAIA